MTTECFFGGAFFTAKQTSSHLTTGVCNGQLENEVGIKNKSEKLSFK